jgi:sporulation protein YlmC with PRC-barrel domain
MAREHASRGLRDEASVGPNPRQASELRRLGDLNYKVADGEPDIRGWTVYASTGRELGKVDDLLVDVDAGEVVMLDVDLRREDRHTLAPLRAAWIDHATKRVVLDAREVETDERLPAFARSGTLSDAEVQRFNDDYVNAYGERGVEQERGWRVRRGNEELRFGMAPRADLPATDARRHDVGAAGAVGAAGVAGALGAHAAPRDPDRDRDLDRDLDRDRDHVREAAVRHEAWDAPGAALGAGPTASAASSDPRPGGTAPTLDESRRIDRIMDEVPPPRRHGQEHAPQAPLSSANFVAADPAARSASDRDERRAARTDDASALSDEQGIDPRELDGRVRIDEGATVDERTPMGGVRYEGTETPRQGYGRPDERYGPEYGSGRIGFDHVVTRHPLAADDDPADRPTSGASGIDRDRLAGDDVTERRAESVGRDAAHDLPGDASRTVRYRRYTDAAPRDERR